MPYNGSGVFQLVAGNPVVTGTTISSTVHNNTMSDIANNGLTMAITKDGQQTPTANLPMGGYRHTGVGNAVARTDYASAGQVQDGSTQWIATISGTDTITGTLAVPPLVAYAAGQSFRFLSAGANTTNSVTLNINSIGAKPLLRSGGSALLPGDIGANSIVNVVYDGTNFQIAGQAGRLLSTRVITSSGTYIPTPGTNSVIVEIQGGGGGGAGGPATSAGQVAGGGSGGAGAYVKHRISGGIGNTAVVIGAGGPGGLGGNGAGGGLSSFGAVSAGGGLGGSSFVTSGTASGLGGNGGVASGGNLMNVNGAPGVSTYVSSAASVYIAGIGANSILGSGGNQGAGVTPGAGSGYGSGGGGCVIGGPASALNGGSGAPGVIIVWEYS